MKGPAIEPHFLWHFQVPLFENTVTTSRPTSAPPRDLWRCWPCPFRCALRLAHSWVRMPLKSTWTERSQPSFSHKGHLCSPSLQRTFRTHTRQWDGSWHLPSEVSANTPDHGKGQKWGEQARPSARDLGCKEPLSDQMVGEPRAVGPRQGQQVAALWGHLHWKWLPAGSSGVGRKRHGCQFTWGAAELPLVFFELKLQVLYLELKLRLIRL